MTARRRTAKFYVDRHIDGAPGATVEITPEGLIRVRPLRRRRTYDVLLADVALLIVVRCTRAEVEARRQEKKRRVRRGRVS